MKKILIILIIAVLVAVVALLIAVGMNSFDSESLSKNDIISTSYDITETFSSVDISESVNSIQILPTDGEAKLTVTHKRNVTHSVEVNNGKLTVCEQSETKWYENISFNLKSTKTVLYLPEGEYYSLRLTTLSGEIYIDKDYKFDEILLASASGSISAEAQKCKLLSIETSSGEIALDGISDAELLILSSSGDVSVRNSSLKSISLETSSGNIKLTSTELSGTLSLISSSGDTKINSITLASLSHRSSSGDFDAYDVISDADIIITTSSGDVDLKSSDAKSITVNTSSGDVFATLLSDKSYDVISRSGNVRIPENDRDTDSDAEDAPAEPTGFCKVRTSSGEIEISVKGN